MGKNHAITRIPMMDHKVAFGNYYLFSLSNPLGPLPPVWPPLRTLTSQSQFKDLKNEYQDNYHGFHFCFINTFLKKVITCCKILNTSTCVYCLPKSGNIPS